MASVLVRASVDRVERLTPAFTRVWFAGPELAGFGTPGETFDQRIKIIFPSGSGRLPDLAFSENWWEEWQAIPEEERGVMRTYSIRDLVGGGDDARVVVDFVLHLADGQTGPASRWANTASVGDQVLLFGPTRGEIGGGVEFRPSGARRILLAGDETAAPAISRILLDLEPGLTGDAFIEVPSEADILTQEVPLGFEVHWLPRDVQQRSLRSLGTSEPRRGVEPASQFGSRLIPAVVEHLGIHPHGRIQDADTEFPVWETPIFSSLGEELEGGNGVPDLYVWIAGESGVVTTLRRHLVREAGLARSQVAFMGYWRQGVAMRG
ncbi:MAG: siderophore-interacting protein [Propionibacteriaceae bacterium]|nr:siderophore-interacting protein [Propionibacteriaceae bacterium]